MLNHIFFIFGVVSLISALYRSLFLQDWLVWLELLEGLWGGFDHALGLSLSLIIMLWFWSGLLAIAQEAKFHEILRDWLKPFWRRVMPDIPSDDPVLGVATLTFLANCLGLDNAMTPFGIKTMQGLQRHNPRPQEASNAQIFFAVINASSLTLIPISIFMYRTRFGASAPTSVFIPILLSTACSTLIAFLMLAYYQKISLRDWFWGKFFVVYLTFFLGIILYFSGLAHEQQLRMSAFIGYAVIALVISSLLGYGWYKKVPIAAVFMQGAAEGVQSIYAVFPYLLGMLLSVGLLRHSGVLQAFETLLRWMLNGLAWNDAFVPAMSTMFFKPFSGSAARALMIDTMQSQGADSFAAFVASVAQGSSDTLLYVLTVYFGAVNIRRTRHALQCGLVAELVGFIAAIGSSYWFFKGVF